MPASPKMNCGGDERGECPFFSKVGYAQGLAGESVANLTEHEPEELVRRASKLREHQDFYEGYCLGSKVGQGACAYYPPAADPQWKGLFALGKLVVAGALEAQDAGDPASLQLRRELAPNPAGNAKRRVLEQLQRFGKLRVLISQEVASRIRARDDDVVRLAAEAMELRSGVTRILDDPALPDSLRRGAMDAFNALLKKVTEARADPEVQAILDDETRRRLAAPRPAEPPTPPDPKAAAKEAEDSFRVSAEEAQMAELRFLERVRANLMPPLTLLDPFKEGDLQVKAWGSVEQTDDAAAVAAFAAPLKMDPRRLPRNASLRFTADKRTMPLLGRKLPRVVIEAAFVSHWRELALNGHDSKPAGLEELGAALRTRLAEADLGNYAHVLALASPTGWDEAALREVRSSDFATRFTSRRASVFLLDPTTGERAYNEQDAVARAYEPYLRVETDPELRRRVERTAVDLALVADNLARVQDVAKEAGVHPKLARAALLRLQERGVGRYDAKQGAFHLDPTKANDLGEPPLPGRA